VGKKVTVTLAFILAVSLGLNLFLAYVVFYYQERVRLLEGSIQGGVSSHRLKAGTG
jgi:hypothetical protein